LDGGIGETDRQNYI